MYHKIKAKYTIVQWCLYVFVQRMSPHFLKQKHTVHRKIVIWDDGVGISQSK